MEEDFGYDLSDWEKAKLEAEQYLIKQAAILGQREYIFYSTLASIIKTIKIDAHSVAMSHLLAQISEKTYLSHGFMLSALVVSKEYKIPGEGFFELAKKLYKDDKVYEGRWYFSEVNKIKKYAKEKLGVE